MFPLAVAVHIGIVHGYRLGMTCPRCDSRIRKDDPPTDLAEPET
jgi:hypothetical protein